MVDDGAEGGGGRVLEGHAEDTLTGRHVGGGVGAVERHQRRQRLGRERVQSPHLDHIVWTDGNNTYN